MVLRSKAVIFFFFLFGSVSAQEMWGISNSNYSGNMGIFLNPSTIVAAPYKYEYFLVGGDFFAQNSYMYSPADRKIVPRSVFGTVPDTKNWFDIYEGATQKGFSHMLIMGPSYINSSKKTLAWGFHTAYRNESSVLGVPTDFAKYIYEEYSYPPFDNRSFSSASFSTAWMRWLELGGTYGKVFMEKEKDFLKWAVTGNLLMSSDGLYLDSRQLDYTIVDSTLSVINVADATIGYATDAKHLYDPAVSILPIRGMGVSTTAGVTYIHKRHPGAYECGEIADAMPKYKYRVGLSLIDLGFVHYFNQDSVLNLQTTTGRSMANLDSVKYVSIGNTLHYLDTSINSTSGIQRKSFTMFVPTAISLQFDYAIMKRLYANATWVNRIYYSVKELARGNQLSLSARYEKRIWEANLNYSLFEYSKSALGVGLRYGFFVIGTDRLLEWLGTTDVQTFDFFFGIKFNFCDKPFKKKDCPAYISD